MTRKMTAGIPTRSASTQGSRRRRPAPFRGSLRANGIDERHERRRHALVAVLLQGLRGEVARPLDIGAARAERVADDDGVGAVAAELVVQLLDDGVWIAARLLDRILREDRHVQRAGLGGADPVASRSASTGVIARSACGSTYTGSDRSAWAAVLDLARECRRRHDERGQGGERHKPHDLKVAAGPGSKTGRVHWRRPRARSSGDRARASGARGRRFESLPSQNRRSGRLEATPKVSSTRAALGETTRPSRGLALDRRSPPRRLRRSLAASSDAGDSRLP